MNPAFFVYHTVSLCHFLLALFVSVSVVHFIHKCLCSFAFFTCLSIYFSDVVTFYILSFIIFSTHILYMHIYMADYVILKHAFNFSNKGIYLSPLMLLISL